MKKANKMIVRLRREGVRMVFHNEPDHSFAMSIDNKIYIPLRHNLHSSESQFAMAHELGHVFQFKNSSTFKQRANMYCRTGEPSSGAVYSLLFSVFLLWIELEAWIKAFFILKEEGISRKGFFKHAWRCYKTYLTYEIYKTVLFILLFCPFVLLMSYVLKSIIDQSNFWLVGLLVYGCIISFCEIANILLVVSEVEELKKDELLQQNKNKKPTL